MEQTALVNGLSDPAAYPHLDREQPPPPIEVLETHISTLFFAGDHVYKTKKPVDLGFLDYRTLEQRRHFCEEEVRLGRRLSPEVYLGVAPICRFGESGLRIHGAGTPLEWAVEMLRLPEHEMLSSKLQRGELDNSVLDAVAARLVAFHAAATTGLGVDEYGAADAVLVNVEENWEQLRPWIDYCGEESGRTPLLSSALYRFLRERARGFVEERRELFSRRVDQGRIREGHGDLHAGNICVTREGLKFYDCIEFSRRLRCGDVACDLAFLAMDLDHNGFAAFSTYLARRYAELAGDSELEQLLPFYKGYRAVVRAKVAALRGLDERLDSAQRRALVVEASGYLHLAAAYELPPALILMCGLSGVGKSWVARRLRRPLHAQLHQSDVRRRQLAAAAGAGSGYGEGLYSAELKARTYRDLLEAASDGIAAGRTVIADATFSSAATRRPFLDLAARLGVPAWVVLVEAPPELVRERLGARETDPREASEATYEVYLAQRQSFEPPDEVAPGHVIRVTSSDETCEVPAARLIEHMITLTA